ncbi:hypothetical protein BGZ97_009444, partial [Linnemannia gamsii]
ALNDQTAALSHQTAVSPKLHDEERGIKACYFRGSGLGSTFIDYLFHGITGHDIRELCIEVYKYIVKNYNEDYELWMFGLSRGAYTVRCVAGMINNCGIIKYERDNHQIDDATIDDLCNEVYRIYRSPNKDDKPLSEEMQVFKARASHTTATPIKFMGLLDTVGSLGLPRFEGGVGLDYPEFYDLVVSSIVEHVYHACAIHDRLWAFRPSYAARDQDSKFEIHEQWFPGCHYDIGRQHFRFFPQSLARFATFQGEIKPNLVIADLVLKWMLESIRTRDPDHHVIPDINNRIVEIDTRMTSGKTDVGDGDIYDKVLDHGPFGTIHTAINMAWSNTTSLLNNFLPALGTRLQRLGLNTITDALTERRDRRIPSSRAVLILNDYMVGGRTIGDLAAITETRYPSRTVQRFKQYME